MNLFEAFCNFFMRLQNSKRQKRNMISSECGVVLCFSILLWEVVEEKRWLGGWGGNGRRSVWRPVSHAGGLTGRDVGAGGTTDHWASHISGLLNEFGN